MKDIITATVEPDHVLVRIFESCIFEYSDDGREWHSVPPIMLRSDEVSVIFYDRTAPPNRPRYYLARTRERMDAPKQLVVVVQAAPKWWLRRKGAA